MQELLGHNDMKTTMIDTHVLNRGGRRVTSPLDELKGVGRDIPSPFAIEVAAVALY